jgi:hypothetical protein
VDAGSILLPITLPKDDLIRAADRLELIVDCPPVADAGSLLLPITLPIRNVLPLLIFVLKLLTAGSL